MFATIEQSIQLQNQTLFIFFYKIFSFHKKSNISFVMFRIVPGIKLFPPTKRICLFSLCTPSSRNIYIKEKFFFNYNTFDVNLIDIFPELQYIYRKRSDICCKVIQKLNDFIVCFVMRRNMLLLFIVFSLELYFMICTNIIISIIIPSIYHR